jgi:hypothetical protein
MNCDISFEQLLLQITNIEPTYNVYADTYAVKHFGEYLYTIINFQKWKSCNTLDNDVFKCITELFPLNMTQLAKITQILKDSRDQNEDPLYTKSTIDKYIIDEYCKKHNFSRDISIDDINKAKSYLEFSNTLYMTLTAVYKKYEIDWSYIEDSYERISDKMEEIYGYLEKNDEFIKAEEEMNNITNLVDIKIISRYNEFVNDDLLQDAVESCFTDVMNELKTKGEIKSLIQNTIIPINIKIHKLNICMKRGQNTLINTIRNLYN